MSRSDDITIHAGAAGAAVACPACGVAAGPASYCGACGAELGDQRIGSVLQGRYRVDRLLAKGGMGRVYRATHLALGEPCVVKFLLSADEDSSGELRARFRREAQLLARLGHPNAVAVLDYGDDGVEPFIVLELVRGVPLSALLEPGAPRLPLARVGAIFEQLLQVAEAAHGAGIVHRDLKPDNVMLVDAGDRLDRVKLLDFGLAIVAASPDAARLTRAGVVLGTPIYMSPEQCRGDDASPPTDVYSLGVMLYEVLAGAPPFVGGVAELIARHMYAAPPPLPDVAEARNPGALARLVARMLAKEPRERPTAAAARDELAAILRGADAETLAAAERLSRASLDRSARAIGTAAAAPDAADPRPANVLVCCADRARFEELAVALGVHGLVAVPWVASGSFAERMAAGDLAAILVEHGEAVAWAADARAASGIPVVVFGIRDTAQLASAIRLGVADAAMEQTSDGEVGFRVRRAIAGARRDGGTR